MLENTISLGQIVTWQNIIYYLLAINIITFLAMWLDKRKARKGSWRISEKALFTLVLLGGGVGGILGMYIFRHKTQKSRFVVGFPFILLFEIAVGIFLYFQFWH